MRILFVSRGSAAPVFGLVPLATAARNAGHEVLVTSTEDMVPVVTSVGLPAVPVSERSEEDYGVRGRDGTPLAFPERGAREQRLFAGGWYGRLAAGCLNGLRDLTCYWRPDLIVGGRLDYAAALLAASIGVPFARQAVDIGEWSEVDEGAAAELAPELAGLGVDTIPGPDLAIEICPPSLRPAGAPEAEYMRWRPGNTQRRVEPWMLTRGSRPRVVVTAGSRATPEQHVDYLRPLIEAVHGLGAEVLVAVPKALAEAVAPIAGRSRVGWIPLDVVAPTCDLFVHHAGGTTSFAAMDSGVPQLVVPEEDATFDLGRRMDAAGVAIALHPDDLTAQSAGDACRRLLQEPSYRIRAAEVAAEIRSMTPPSETVRRLEKLAG